MSLIKYLVGRIISANYKIDQLKKENEQLKNELDSIKTLWNGRRMKDFFPIDTIPEIIINRLKKIDFSKHYPIELRIPWGGNTHRTPQSLGNQIPIHLTKWLNIHFPEIIFHKMKASGYPDAKVSIEDIILLWEWKSFNINKQEGARIVISKYPNTRINQILNESEKKYHIWVEVNYDLKTNVDTKEDIVSITRIKLNCIQPELEINTKFEINTTMKQINNNHNIITI